MQIIIAIKHTSKQVRLFSATAVLKVHWHEISEVIDFDFFALYWIYLVKRPAWDQNLFWLSSLGVSSVRPAYTQYTQDESQILELGQTKFWGFAFVLYSKNFRFRSLKQNVKAFYC